MSLYYILHWGEKITCFVSQTYMKKSFLFTKMKKNLYIFLEATELYWRMESPFCQMSK